MSKLKVTKEERELKKQLQSYSVTNYFSKLDNTTLDLFYQSIDIAYRKLQPKFTTEEPRTLAIPKTVDNYYNCGKPPVTTDRTIKGTSTDNSVLYLPLVVLEAPEAELYYKLFPNVEELKRMNTELSTLKNKIVKDYTNKFPLSSWPLLSNLGYFNPYPQDSPFPHIYSELFLRDYSETDYLNPKTLKTFIDVKENYFSQVVKKCLTYADSVNDEAIFMPIHETILLKLLSDHYSLIESLNLIALGAERNISFQDWLKFLKSENEEFKNMPPEWWLNLV